MKRKLFLLVLTILALCFSSDAFAQIKYKVYHKDLTIKVQRCFVQSDGSCIVDFLMENNGLRDWRIDMYSFDLTGHKNRAYDDMGNSYSKISFAVGNTSMYVYGWKHMDFPAGISLKVRVKIYDVSEIATVIKRVDVDIISREWDSGYGDSHKAISIMNIPITR